MFSKLKQIKDLRSQAKELQTKLAQEVITAEGSWGKIKITIDGNMEVHSLVIDPSLLTQDNQENLEKGLKETFNDAVKKVQKSVAQKMAKDGGFPNLTDLLK